MPTLIYLLSNNSSYDAKSAPCFDSKNSCHSKDIALSIKCTLFFIFVGKWFEYET